MSIDIESLEKKINEITSQIRELYEELQELESERLELEDYKSILMLVAVDPIDDPCPECGTQLKDKLTGGVYCPSCGYWFCF